MSIRLSKACKDLNVGMSTALEFLAKKGHKLAHDPNLKLEDDLHLLLAKEFNKDMALKIESERISQERHLKEKAATVALDGYNKPKPVEKQPETIHVTISIFGSSACFASTFGVSIGFSTGFSDCFTTIGSSITAFATIGSATSVLSSCLTS